MVVRFRLNLGLVDARRLHLDAKECVEGAAVDVGEAAGELLKRGIAEEVSVMQAVPEEPLKGVKGKKSKDE